MGKLQTAMLDDSTADGLEPEAQLSPLHRLREMWTAALADPEPKLDDSVEELINCGVASIRYALLTQLLGKLADHRRDALSIQRGEATTAEAAGRWDPRSFCQANVVPWVAEAGQVLGTSPDPYVNKPLRRNRLDEYPSAVRNRPLWDKLVVALRTVEERNDPAHTESRLRQCMASLARRYNELNVRFDVPQRISLNATVSLVTNYLAQPSGGERPQIIVAALMRTVGPAFGVFDRVERQAINEADAANASPGDVICYQDNEQVLAVEVKDRTVTLDDLDVAILKARRSRVTELLFATASPQIDDAAIVERTAREFGLGINVYQLDLETLLRVLLTIAGETSRTRFLTLVGEELNDRVTQPSHKLAWQELLRTL